MATFSSGDTNLGERSTFGSGNVRTDTGPQRIEYKSAPSRPGTGAAADAAGSDAIRCGCRGRRPGRCRWSGRRRTRCGLSLEAGLSPADALRRLVPAMAGQAALPGQRGMPPAMLGLMQRLGVNAQSHAGGPAMNPAAVSAMLQQELMSALARGDQATVGLILQMMMLQPDALAQSGAPAGDALAPGSAPPREVHR